jgi:hypothetical protein
MKGALGPWGPDGFAERATRISGESNKKGRKTMTTTTRLAPTGSDLPPRAAALPPKPTLGGPAPRPRRALSSVLDGLHTFGHCQASLKLTPSRQ